MKFVKAITHCFTQDGVEINKVIGVYSPDKIQLGLEEVRKVMTSENKKNIKDEKDCCNYFLEFEDEKGTKEHFYTGDFILNELNL